MSFRFSTLRPRRRPNLTPMVDVVFLLLVFFMLAARFGQDGDMPLSLAGGQAPYSGPPRLVDILPDAVTLNGATIPLERLASDIEPLTESRDDTIILRALQDAPLQRLVTVMQVLEGAGFTRLVLIEE